MLETTENGARVGEAKRQQTDGALTLWNARLELLDRAGDLKALIEHLRSPIDPIADNSCGNNCNCGKPEIGIEPANPRV
jgi:hypothetical protein